MRQTASASVLVAAVVILGSCSRYAFKSEAQIRAELMRETPIGADVGAVDELIARRHFKELGRLIDHVEHDMEIPIEIRAAGSIHVLLGEYHSPFRTSVDAFWFIDSAGRVKAIYVRKTTDAL